MLSLVANHIFCADGEGQSLVLWEALIAKSERLVQYLREGYKDIPEGYLTIEKIKYIAEWILQEQQNSAITSHELAHGFIIAYDACRYNLEQSMPEKSIKERLEQMKGEKGEHNAYKIALLKDQLEEENRDKGGMVGVCARLYHKSTQLETAKFLFKGGVPCNALYGECEQISKELAQSVIDHYDCQEDEDRALTDSIFEQYEIYLSQKSEAREELGSLEAQIRSRENECEALIQRIRAVDPVRVGEEPLIFRRIYLWVRHLLHWINLWRQPDRSQIDALSREYMDNRSKLDGLKERLSTARQTIEEPFLQTSSTLHLSDAHAIDTGNFSPLHEPPTTDPTTEDPFLPASTLHLSDAHAIDTGNFSPLHEPPTTDPTTKVKEFMISHRENAQAQHFIIDQYLTFLSYYFPRMESIQVECQANQLTITLEGPKETNLIQFSEIEELISHYPKCESFIKRFGRGVKVEFPERITCLVADGKVNFLAEEEPKFYLVARVAKIKFKLSSLSLYSPDENHTGNVGARIELLLTNWWLGQIKAKCSIADIDLFLSKVSSKDPIFDGFLDQL